MMSQLSEKILFLFKKESSTEALPLIKVASFLKLVLNMLNISYKKPLPLDFYTTEVL